MAKASYIDALSGGLPDPIRLALRRMSEYYFNGLRLGIPDDGVRAENFQAYCFSGTTPAVANTEFTLAHDLGTTPYLLTPCLNLANVNEQIIPLTVSRAADGKRIYLKSSVASAAFRVWVE